MGRRVVDYAGHSATWLYCNRMECRSRLRKVNTLVVPVTPTASKDCDLCAVARLWSDAYEHWANANKHWWPNEKKAFYAGYTAALDVLHEVDAKHDAR